MGLTHDHSYPACKLKHVLVELEVLSFGVSTCSTCSIKSLRIERLAEWMDAGLARERKMENPKIDLD